MYQISIPTNEGFENMIRPLQSSIDYMLYIYVSRRNWNWILVQRRQQQ